MLNGSHKHGIDFTLPGYNYLGPGTHIQELLINNMKPTTELDRRAFDHDFEYLTAKSEDDIISADHNMIGKLGFDPLSDLIDTALGAKHAFGMDASFLSNISEKERELYSELYKIRNNQWYGQPYDQAYTEKIIEKHQNKYVTQ